MCSEVGKMARSVKFVFQHEDLTSTILGKVAQACSLSKRQEDPWAHWLASEPSTQLVSSRMTKDPVSKEVKKIC